MTKRIAMWSGPRNISTAMMRAWENRSDCFVCDEPLYANYLKVTELEHPGAAEIISHHEDDWRKIVIWLTGPTPDASDIFYQKHMAHHLLPEIDRGWLDEVTNCFLIREPREMLTSLIKVISEPTLADTGLPQQVEIFEQVKRTTGKIPPVLDPKDVLDNPRKLLGMLCDAIEIPFDESMLTWPPGPRETDGIWAKHWYAAVEMSTGFKPYTPKDDPLPEQFEALNDECQQLFDHLQQYRL